jgi:hypothetical protein
MDWWCSLGCFTALVNLRAGIEGTIGHVAGSSKLRRKNDVAPNGCSQSHLRRDLHVHDSMAKVAS